MHERPDMLRGGRETMIESAWVKNCLGALMLEGDKAVEVGMGRRRHPRRTRPR